MNQTAAPLSFTLNERICRIMEKGKSCFLFFAYLSTAAVALTASPIQAQEEAVFEPYVHEFTDTIQFEWNPSDFCPQFSPDGWIRLYFGHPELATEILFQPEAESLAGGVTRIETPFGAGKEILVFVNRHDTDPWSINIEMIYQDVEVEKWKFDCRPGQHGGTEVEVGLLILGINDMGNRAVRAYVEGGNIEANVAAYRDAITEFLNDSR